MSDDKNYWALPVVLHYYVCNKDFSVVDRLANSINPSVALQTLYDAVRNIESIFLSEGKKKEELCSTVKTLVKNEELDCGKVISIAKVEAESIAKLIKESFNKDVMNLLKVISIKALEGDCPLIQSS
ncbi:hypothetical protein EYM_02745 [Ignicoccus islandicus DSM 13165]|uniref:Uncharacterized protein n=1 Tax=Ignicoccus islandicus DSM 13165 TaxID=940295 RepID=A0A0U3ED29_9CREN|nr:hypothetical protein [Ignicoccus islandicus]ALU12355.1 hypothetical protein EYM_02745 [Ignicoccus islandicus DSM 13165]